MHRTPSNGDLQKLILDLCRASVTLRNAESRGVIAGGESDRLADGIDHWLNACESQITPILEQSSQAAPAPNVIDFAEKREAVIAPGPAPDDVAENSPEMAPSEEHLADLRRQLQMISSALPKI